MQGPVLSIPISPSTGNQLGTTGQKAAAARAELKQLEAQLIKMAPLGKIPAELNANIAVAKGRVDALNALQKEQRQTFKDFKTGKYLGHRALQGARGLAEAIKSGNYSQLLYSAGHLIASPAFSRMAAKLKMPVVQELAKQALPALYGTATIIERLIALDENYKSNKAGQTHAMEMFAKGGVDKKHYAQLYHMGEYSFGDPGDRDIVSAWTFGAVDSRATMREKMLKAAGGDEEKDRFRKFALNDNSWKMPGLTLNDIQSDIQKEYMPLGKFGEKKLLGGIDQIAGQKLIDERIKATKKVVDAKAIELQVATLEPQVEQRVRLSVQLDFEKAHPGFAKMMEEVDKKSDEIKARIDITRPFQDIDASEQYRRDEKEHVAHEVFQEYHHGFVPFNRSSK